jgi:Flp pilus assembly protein CpaB
LNRPRITGIILALGGILLVVVGFLFISGILNRMMAPPPAPTAPPVFTESVLVTTRDLPLGSVLSAGDLVLIEVPADFVPPSALDDLGFAEGRITKIPLVSGEMVLAHHLADPTNIARDLGFILAEDQVLLAFPADDLMSQLDILQTGDLVDILASLEIEIMPEEIGLLVTGEEQPEPEERLFTFNALQRITLSAVVVEVVRSTTRASAGAAVSEIGAEPQPTPTPAPSEIEPQGILLALSPQDALVLKHLKDAGAVIDIVLRAPTSSQIFDLNPVSQQYLIERFGLEIIR